MNFYISTMKRAGVLFSKLSCEVLQSAFKTYTTPVSISYKNQSRYLAMQRPAFFIEAECAKYANCMLQLVVSDTVCFSYITSAHK